MGQAFRSFVERLAKLRASLSEETDADVDRSEPTAPSSDPITALIVPKEQTRSDGWFSPLDSHHSVRVRRRLVRWSMAFCFAVALLCTAAVPVLSSFRVQEIEIVGNEHVSDEEILAAAGVALGDESLVCSEREIGERIVNQISYIKAADVSCGTRRIRISLTECRVRWAWLLDDGRVALMDEQRYVADIGDASATDASVCRLRLPQGKGTEVIAGAYVDGSTAGLDVLARVESALDSFSFASPELLDISDRYRVVLELQGGVVIDLNECRDPLGQLGAVERGLTAYLEAHPNILVEHTLHVNVDDALIVSVRPVPREMVPDAENE